MIDVSQISGPIKIVVGAGPYERPGWVLTQHEQLDLLKREDWEVSFSQRPVTAILAEHVWEHLTFEEAKVATRICYDFLEPGGYVRCAVPDAYFPNEEYQNTVKPGGPGPKDHSAASHKIVYNYRMLWEVFESAGFGVRLLEYWDEQGQFHYQEWDEKAGFIYRSKRFDHRNQGGTFGFTSLILDAIKPS